MPDATIVIATRNRIAHVRRAVEASLAQRGLEIEVLVLDDASEDGTAGALAAEFPAARVERSERPLGAVGQRNRGAMLAGGRILFWIDDDTVLPSPDTVAQTVADFDDDRIGAVAVPMHQPAHGPQLFQAAPEPAGTWCTFLFIGAAAATRRDVWLAAGGYRPNPVPRADEEGELCLRLLDAGFVTRLGRADPAVHEEAADRDWDRIRYWDMRNEVLHAWWYAPGARLPGRVARIGANAVRLGAQWRSGAFLRGFGAGLRAMHGGRAPVSGAAWDLAIELSRAPRELEEIAARLPAPDLERLRQRTPQISP